MSSVNQKRGDDSQIISFPYMGKQIVLIIQNYDEIDVDDITKIQYHNIMGEILTSSTVMNRIGNMLAEANQMFSEAKLDFDIFEAQMSEEIRKKLEFETVDAKGNTKTKIPTISEIEFAVKRSLKYKVKRKSMIEAQKNVDILNSLYWAVQSKDKKLNKLSEKLRPEDMEGELLESSVNNILIKVYNQAIK